ncbi:MAG TPA: TolC family protein [Verrucomicrobiae bacterium]|nr:TolC family protein [Verrucomicrobiae bacterium]
MNRFLASTRTRPGWCLTLLLTVFVLNEAQPAPNAPATRLSLKQAQDLAFQRNWDLLAAKSGIDAAAAQLMVAKEFPNPTLSWSTMKIDPRGNATPLGNNVSDRSYDTIVSINQLVEIGGKRHARQNSARAGILAAKARFFDARRSLDQGITKAYVAALLADENERVLVESARSLRREADIAEARFKAGDISDADRKQIENNADVFDLQAKSAEATAAQARIQVEVLMGVKEPRGNWVAEDSLEKLGLTLTTLEAHTGPGARPDVLAAEADLRKAESEVSLQKKIRVPDPTFSLFYERNPPGPPGPDTLGLGLSFPLPLWNQNRGNIKAAEAARQQSELVLGKVSSQAQADLANAEIAYQEAQQRWKRYQDLIRPRSAQVRESIAFAYSKGGASLVDLLTAERDDNNVRLAAAQALSDTASAAADLKAARSVVSESDITQAK